MRHYTCHRFVGTTYCKVGAFGGTMKGCIKPSDYEV